MSAATDASSPEYRVLASLARGILGDAYDTEIPPRMLDTIGALASADRNRLLGALRALDTRAGALLLTGSTTPVSWRNAAEAGASVAKLRASRPAARRNLGGTILALAVTACYGHPSPEWERIGYPGPLGAPPDEPRRLSPLSIERGERLVCDVAVVGSGAGGGCAAGILASAGLDVIVLEKGGYHAEGDYHHHEMQSLRDLYLHGGFLSTTDFGCQIIAGSTLGGGTVVNFTTSLRAPDIVLRQWSELSGIDDFSSDDFQASYARVSERLSVNADSSAAGKRDELMEAGLKKLGWHVDEMSRNVRGCTQDERCGYCGFGCRHGAKQSSVRTYLEDAADHHARIIVDADVRRVLVSGGRATGVWAQVGEHRVVVEARAVVVAGGSIESPALLLRSGLGGRVGKSLHLHPGSATWGIFDQDVRMWEGTLQARFSAELRNDNDPFGPLLETVPVHPGLGSAAVPWLSAADHRGRMAGFSKLSMCAVLPRDETEGRVMIGKDGNPRIRYKIGAHDQQRVLVGQIAAAKVLEAAGATEIYSGHRAPVSYRTSSQKAQEEWAGEVRRIGVDQTVTPYFSFHQMSSCRMGVDPKSSAIGPHNESHELEDLFVIDASAFPAASGVNPMLSVYALADRAATRLADRLT